MMRASALASAQAGKRSLRESKSRENLPHGEAWMDDGQDRQNPDTPSKRSFQQSSVFGDHAAESPRVDLATLPKEFLVSELQYKRKQRFLSAGMIMFWIYLAVYFSMLSMQRNIEIGFKVEQATEEEIALQTTPPPSSISYEEIKTIDDWWDWVEFALIPIVFRTEWYNGDELSPELKFTVGLQSRIVGGLRFAQYRGKENAGPFCYESKFDDVESRCLSEEPDHRSFGESPENKPHNGFIHTIDESGVGGFFVDITFSHETLETSVERIKSLKEDRWVDDKTRKLDIEMAIYNSNYKQWAFVLLETELDLAGGVWPEYRIQTLKLDQYEFQAQDVEARLALEIIFLLVVLYFFFLDVYVLGLKARFDVQVYIQMVGGPMIASGNWVSHIINFMIIGMWIDYIIMPVRRNLMNEHPFETFPDIKPIADWEEHYMNVNIVNILWQTMRSIQYLQLNRSGRVLFVALSRAIPEVLKFIPAYAIVMVGYSIAGHFLYGLRSEDWATFDGALFSVFEMNFGLYDTTPLYKVGGFGSALFIYSGTIVLVIIMLNIFLAILMQSWDILAEAQQEDRERSKLVVRQSIFWNIQAFARVVMIPLIVYDKAVKALCGENIEEEITRTQFIKVLRGQDVPDYVSVEMARWYWRTTDDASVEKEKETDIRPNINTS
eukprot:TRINITY_DN357_c0_g1_i5.p1 TRINITY_DN357_c0_g1~~TRINITY_DN357_c0_g1_i5.p1  ORF type:complete len:665 (+),score=137.67 TRINITY_DN357_c0_g1_i5:51-2045(+)